MTTSNPMRENVRFLRHQALALSKTSQARGREIGLRLGSIADAIETLSERNAVLEDLQRQIIAQYRADLSSAHAEICKLQNLDPATHSWPDWTPQANTLRWFDTLETASTLQEEHNGSS